MEQCSGYSRKEGAWCGQWFHVMNGLGSEGGRKGPSSGPEEALLLTDETSTDQPSSHRQSQTARHYVLVSNQSIDREGGEPELGGPAEHSS